MRPKPASYCLAAVLFAGGLAFVGQNHSRGQESQSAGAASRPVTSLELGEIYDLQAQQRFENGLTVEEQSRLVKLASRSVLADADCPLPSSEPTAPFYLKLRSPMTQDFSASLRAAGVSFIGYAAEHTHFVRAVDAAALPGIRALIQNNSNVAGTALQSPEDICDPKAWPMVNNLAFASGEFRILFWKDVKPIAALELLEAFDAPILEASTDGDGGYDLETPFIDTRLDRPALLAFVASPLVEWIQTRPIWRSQNTVSAALSNAAATDVGPSTSYNLDGTGLVAGVWDGGTGRDTHQAAQGAPSPSPINNGTKRIIKGTALGLDGGSTSSHPTHVIGTIMGDGTGNSAARGYAPKVCVASYDWNSMESERRVARHTWRHVADNHSYGNAGGGTGGYDSSAQASDIDIRDILLNMCKSAGNDGSGDNTCTDDTCMKNAFVIGSTGDSGTISGFSSRGPSDDGRLLPHYCANGEELLSHGSGSDTSFVQSGWSGTSMSSPSACGSLVLLAQLFKRENSNRYFSPDVARAVVALTAEDRGNTGPDYRYGFGIVDCKRAADLILADKATSGRHIVHGTIRQGETVDFPVTVTSSATPLRVVLSWLDIYASTGAGTKLINDLDLELIHPNGTTINYPWRGLTATGSQTHVWTRTDANRRDNIELATVDTPATGNWTVRVRGFNIPATPQSGVPNLSTGFVLTCERPLTINKVVREDALNTGSAVNIPDNSATGISRTFNISGVTGTVSAVRVYVDIKHTRRSDIRIQLRHPDTTTLLIEQNGSTRRDLLAIIPDTRQNQSDISSFIGKGVNGTWTVIVSDQASGSTGALNYLTLEVDVDGGGTANTPPNADAGVDQNVNEGTAVNLNGTGSRDPDMDTLSFSWAQIGGPTVTLTGGTTATPSFTAPQVTVNTALTFRLTVDDGNGGTDTDDVVVTVLNVVAPNTPPNANAGTDYSLDEDTQGTLNGSGSSDPDLDVLTYAWTQISGPAVTLTGAGTVTATFLAPQVAASTPLTFRLTVNDGRGGTDTDDIVVTVLDVPVNQPPTANAGADQNVAYGQVVTLDGAGSTDPENDTLTYAWVQIGGTTSVTLGSSTTVSTTFTAPAVDDTLIFQLLVDDGNGNTALDTVTIEVRATAGGGSGGSGGGGGKGGGGGCSTDDRQGWLWLGLAALALPALLRRREVVTK